MADFSHLKAFEVQAKTSRYEMRQITINDHTPVLIVEPATEANKPFFNALLKESGKATNAMRRGKMKPQTLTESRDRDRIHYSKYIVKGWEYVLDGETGEDAPCTPENVLAFLKNLPDWLFDDLRMYCTDPSNFADQLDVEVLAKN